MGVGPIQSIGDMSKDPHLAVRDLTNVDDPIMGKVRMPQTLPVVSGGAEHQGPDGGGPVNLVRQKSDLQRNSLGVNVALMVPHGSVRSGRGKRAAPGSSRASWLRR